MSKARSIAQAAAIDNNKTRRRCQTCAQGAEIVSEFRAWLEMRADRQTRWTWKETLAWLQKERNYVGTVRMLRYHAEGCEGELYERSKR